MTPVSVHFSCVNLCLSMKDEMMKSEYCTMKSARRYKESKDDDEYF